MQRPIRTNAVLAAFAFGAFHWPGAPTFAQAAELPLPAAAASWPPTLTVDPGLWLPGTGHLLAILTFDHHPSADEVAAVEGSGLALHRYRALPMVAVRGTSTQLRSLLGLPGLRSIFLDRRLVSFPEESARVAHGASSFASLVAYQLPAVHDVTVAVIESSGDHAAEARELEGLGDARLIRVDTGAPMSLATALEGFDWVFRNRLKYGIEAIANSWGTSADVSPDDPIAVATALAHDAGLAVVFAAGDGELKAAAVNRYAEIPGAIRATARGTEP